MTWQLHVCVIIKLILIIIDYKFTNSIIFLEIIDYKFTNSIIFLEIEDWTYELDPWMTINMILSIRDYVNYTGYRRAMSLQRLCSTTEAVRP